MLTKPADMDAPDHDTTAPAESGAAMVNLLDLSKQQRNLILLRPVFALELAKNSYGVDATGTASLMEGVDTHYLVLSALDFMMEGTTMNMGCTQDEVVMHLTNVTLQMKPSLTFPLARKVAETVIDTLDNKVKGYKEFDFDYFDAGVRQIRPVRFRLVSYEPDLEDVYRYRPTSEGYLVYLGMLDMAPEDAQVVMEKMLDVLLKRGAFDVALEVAKRARKLSLEYRQLIGDRLNQAIRAPGSVKWVTDVAAKLVGARSHVQERQAEDQRMEDAVREAVIKAEDPKARLDLSQLLKTLQGAGLIRAYLVNDILVAPQRFLDAQKALFRAKRPGGLPDLESRLFPQLLGLSSKVLAANAEHVVSGFHPPMWPKVYDLNSVFSLLLERRAEDAPPEDDTGEITPYVPYPDRFPKELILKVEDWITQQFERSGTYQLDELVLKGAEAGFDLDMLHFAVIRLFRCYAPTESSFPHVSVQANGRFVLDVASGTNLQFTSTKDFND
jgi:hypothetical protein